MKNLRCGGFWFLLKLIAPNVLQIGRAGASFPGEAYLLLGVCAAEASGLLTLEQKNDE